MGDIHTSKKISKLPLENQRINLSPMNKKIYFIALLSTFYFAFLSAQSQYVLEFDGTDDYVQSATNLPSMGSGVTIEAWIYAYDLNGNHWENTIVSNELPTQSGVVLRAGDTGDLSFSWGDSIDWSQHFTTTDPLSLNNWHHVAATYDLDTVRLYIDGAEVYKAADSRSLATANPSGTRVGTIIPTVWGNRTWSGRLDDVRIWDVAKSPMDILANQCTALSGTEPNLVAFWNFDDGPGSSVLTDLVGSFDGTLTNMDTTTAWLPDNNCLACSSPAATYSVIDSCDVGEFWVEVNVTSLGDAGMVDLMNDGGAATMTGVGVGMITMGPFSVGDTVTFTLTHDGDSLCNAVSPGITNGFCPIISCGVDNYTYCYGNLDTTWFLYKSGTADPLMISFNAGGIESGTFDSIFIYDGNNRMAPILYSGNNGGDLTGISAVSTNPDGYLLLVVDSDISVSCASASTCCGTSWNWDVECTLPLGIGQEPEARLAVFPNPSQGIFTLEIPIETAKSTLITVYDSFGRKVQEFKQNASKMELDLRDQAVGMYFIRATDGIKHYIAKAQVKR